MPKIFQFLIFLILQILFLPLAIIGAILAFYYEMVVSQKLGVSFTAGQAIQPRWMMHYFETRPDEETVQFIRHFPIESHNGLLGVFAAAIIANRICGYTPTIVKIPESGQETFSTFINTRTTRFDQIFEKYASEMQQIVIMGGSYDLRALQYTQGKTVKVFEVDQEKTQNLKLATMKKAGLSHDWITYIHVDFREESWVEKLIENGFDKTKTTYFHWESVSPYLAEDVVQDTILKVSELSSQGSILAQDFYAKSFMFRDNYIMKRTVKLVEKMGEPLLFAVDMSHDVRVSVESLIEPSSFDLLELILSGHRGKMGQPFYAIAICEKR